MALLAENWGLGDFIVQLPGIQFLLTMGCKVHYFTNEKFKSLLPVHPRLVVHPITNTPPAPTIPPEWGWCGKGGRGLDRNAIHSTTCWLPWIYDYRRHFAPSQYPDAPFYYPKLDFNPNTLDRLEKSMGLKPKQYITFIKSTHEANRNWPEGYWDELIELLSVDFTCVHVGMRRHEKNSYDVPDSPKSIQMNESFSLLETAHLIRGSKAFVSADTGMYHIATAIGAEKVIVLWKPIGGVTWYYPSNFIVNKDLSKQEAFAKILNYIYDTGNLRPNL